MITLPSLKLRPWKSVISSSFLQHMLSKDNAKAKRTTRAQENNRLGLGRQVGRVAKKGNLTKSNRTSGECESTCSRILSAISRLFFALLKSD